MWRAAVVALAAGAAVAPIPASFVERAYSTAAFPLWQSAVTRASNAMPLALFDVLIVVAAVGWVAMIVFEWRARGRASVARPLLRIAGRTIVWASAVYLVFLASWGLNYRRVPLVDKLAFERSNVNGAAVNALALNAAARLNALYDEAHRTGWPDDSRVDPALASAFAAAERDLGSSREAVPGRPKSSMLNPYFRRASVDGMTDPFFLEILVNADLLPYEQPFVVAHEWAHLAGYNDEGEANFVSFLACAHADAPRQYSGWLAIFSEATGLLGRRDRQAAADRLAPGPRADLRAIADRIARHRSARVSDAGWRVYNQYLKANRVEAGALSYSEVIRLVLGTKLGSGMIGSMESARESPR